MAIYNIKILKITITARNVAILTGIWALSFLVEYTIVETKYLYGTMIGSVMGTIPGALSATTIEIRVVSFDANILWNAISNLLVLKRYKILDVGQSQREFRINASWWHQWHPEGIRISKGGSGELVVQGPPVLFFYLKRILKNLAA